MFKLRLLGLAALYLWNVGAQAFVVTDADEFGRHSGKFQVYKTVKKEGKEYLLRSECFVRDPQSISQTDIPMTCGPGKEVLFSSFVNRFDQLTGNALLGGTMVMQFVLVHNVYNKESLSIERGAKNILGPNYEQELKQFKSTMEFLEEFRDDKPHEYLSTKWSDYPAVTRSFIRYLIRSYEPIKELLTGTQCVRNEEGLIESSEGGCFVKNINLVVGKSEFKLNKLSVDEWKTRESAQFRCKQLRTGGFEDWRLPSKEEVAKMSKYKAYLDIDEASYYWTMTEQTTKEDFRVKFNLPDKVTSSGYNGYFSGWCSSHAEVGRMFHGDYEYLVQTYSLYNPTMDKEFNLGVKANLVHSKGKVTYSGTVDTYSSWVGGYYYPYWPYYSSYYYPYYPYSYYYPYWGYPYYRGWPWGWSYYSSSSSSSSGRGGEYQVDPLGYYIPSVKLNQKQQIALICVRQPKVKPPVPLP